MSESTTLDFVDNVKPPRGTLTKRSAYGTVDSIVQPSVKHVTLCNQDPSYSETLVPLGYPNYRSQDINHIYWIKFVQSFQVLPDIDTVIQRRPKLKRMLHIRYPQGPCPLVRYAPYQETPGHFPPAIANGPIINLSTRHTPLRHVPAAETA